MIKTSSGNKMIYRLKYSFRYILLKLSNDVQFLRSDVETLENGFKRRWKQVVILNLPFIIHSIYPAIRNAWRLLVLKEWRDFIFDGFYGRN